MRFFIPITKVDAAQRLVYGTLTEEVLDKAGEVLDYTSSKPHFQEWSGAISKATDGKSVGNVRAMHGKVAAGKLTSLDFDDPAKRITGCAKIVDDAEWEKVEQGVYTGFSIGGEYMKRWSDPVNPTIKRYTAKPMEVSIVDNPCVPTATFEFIKADGAAELRKFQTPKEPNTDLENGVRQRWLAEDGQEFMTKAAAIAHNAELKKLADQEAETAEQQAVVDEATAAAAAAAAPVLATLGKLDASLSSRETAAISSELTTALGVTAEQLEKFRAAHPDHELSKAVTALPAAYLVDGKLVIPADTLKAIKEFVGKTAAPPAAPKSAPKPLDAVTLRKGLYSVSRLACLIEELDWLQCDTEFESAIEGDGSAVPGALKESIARLSAVLRALVAEETEELLDDAEAETLGELLEAAAGLRAGAIAAAVTKTLGDKASEKGKALIDALTKAGARHGKSDKEHLQAAHDHVAKMVDGANCGDDAEKLAKAGARHSKVDLERISKAHDLLCEVGADCAKADPGITVIKDAGGEPLAKGTNIELTKALAKADAFEKALGQVSAQLTATVERIERLEAQPAKPKGAVMAISKSQDSGGSAAATPAGDPVEEFQKYLGGLTPAERNNAVMKAALRNPVRVSAG